MVDTSGWNDGAAPMRVGVVAGEMEGFIGSAGLAAQGSGNMDNAPIPGDTNSK